MARRGNYGFVKRQKELKRQQRKEEKAERNRLRKEDAAATEPQLVELGPLTVVGLQVRAGWQELWTEVPKAWQELRARADEIPGRTDDVFLDVSVAENDGVYTQLVGAEVDAADAVPDGMSALEIPARRYAHLRHDGPLDTIPNAFARLESWAAEHGHTVETLKLDIGYADDGTEAVHDLYVAVAD